MFQVSGLTAFMSIADSTCSDPLQVLDILRWAALVNQWMEAWQKQSLILDINKSKIIAEKVRRLKIVKNSAAENMRNRFLLCCLSLMFAGFLCKEVTINPSQTKHAESEGEILDLESGLQDIDSSRIILNKYK